MEAIYARSTACIQWKKVGLDSSHSYRRQPGYCCKTENGTDEVEPINFVFST